MLQEVQWNTQSCGHKRTREEEHHIENEPHTRLLSATTGTLRVVAHWQDTQFPLTLTSPILDESGALNRHALPGLCFFFAPHVEYIEFPVVHIRLSQDGTPCDTALQRERRSCPIHGPFSCSCPVMHYATTMLQSLVQELGSPRGFQFDVVVDEHCLFSHIFVDTHTHTWSFVVLNLPVPNRMFGPVPLAQFDYPSAIRQNLNRFTVKLQNQAPNPCAHCGQTTNNRCAACSCLICEQCVQACGGCNAFVCHACCDFTDDGGLVCRWCGS